MNEIQSNLRSSNMGIFEHYRKFEQKSRSRQKNALNSMSSTSEKSHTVKLELSNTFHGPKRKINILFTWERSNKGLANRLVDKCC